MVRLLMIPYQNVGKVPRPKMLSLLVGKHALEKMRGASVPIFASPSPWFKSLFSLVLYFVDTLRCFLKHVFRRFFSTKIRYRNRRQNLFLACRRPQTGQIQLGSKRGKPLSNSLLLAGLISSVRPR